MAPKRDQRRELFADCPVNAQLVRRLRDALLEGTSPTEPFFAEIEIGPRRERLPIFEDLPSFDRAITENQDIASVAIETGGYHESPFSSVRLRAEDHRITVEIRNRSEEDASAVFARFSSLENIVDPGELYDGVEQRKFLRGYVRRKLSPVSLAHAFSALLALDDSRRIKIAGVRRIAEGEALDEDIDPNTLSAYLIDGWKSIETMTLSFEQRSVRINIAVVLPTGEFVLQGSSPPNHPHFERIRKFFENQFGFTEQAVGRRKFRTGTLTYRTKKKDPRLLAAGLEELLPRLKSDPPVEGWPPPRVEDAYITSADRLSFWGGPVEKLEGYRNVDAFIAALNAPASELRRLGLSVVGAEDVTFNVNFDVNEKVMAVWSTMPLEDLERRMRPIIRRMGGKLIAQAAGGASTGADEAGFTRILASVGTQVWKFSTGVLAVTGLSAASLFAFFDLNLTSGVEPTHPGAAGERVSLPFDPGSDGVQPIEIGWDTRWSVFSRRSWGVAGESPPERAEITVYRHGVRTSIGAEDAVSPWNMELRAPGLYRVDIAIAGLQEQHVIIEVQEPKQDERDELGDSSNIDR